MISRSLPPMITTGPARASASAFAGQEITPDLISMGSELGCPFLASMKKPEFAAGAEEASCKGDLAKQGASAAALASVAGGLGMGAAAACCPRTTGA